MPGLRRYHPPRATEVRRWRRDCRGSRPARRARDAAAGLGGRSGRHCTIRCDGDSVDGAAFGGPIFYGHASQSANEKPDHPGNVYWYQAKRANEVFQSLDGKQREIALVKGTVPPEQGNATVKLS